MEQLESFLNKYLGEKAPALPEGVRKFLVSIAPWACGLGIIFGILGILAVLGIGAGGYSLFYFGGAYGGYAGLSASLLVSIILSAAMVLCEVRAFPGLMKKSYQGWRWFFYGSLVGLVSGLLSFNGFVGAIVGAIIGWYILFQIRPYYTGTPVIPSAPSQPLPPNQIPPASA